MVRRFFRDVLWQRLVRHGRRGAGRAHALLFGGFCLLLLGTILVGIEHYGAALTGAPAGDPLFHQGLYYAVYEVTLDTAGLLLLAGCGWFAWRRWRADSSIDHHWTDNCVLASLFLLGITGYLVEGARILHEQTPEPGVSYVGLAVARSLQSMGVDHALATQLHFQPKTEIQIQRLTSRSATSPIRPAHRIYPSQNLANQFRLNTFVN